MLLEYGLGELGVPEDLGQQTAPDVFAAMNRHDSSATVRMLQILMAAANPDNLKPQPFQYSDELTAGNARQAAHSATLTR